MDSAALKIDGRTGWRGLMSAARLDRIEQVLIVLLWVWLVQRVVGSFAVNKDGWLLLISETSVMVFTVIRRPTNAITLDLGDWLLAITATAAPLLIQPGYDMFPQVHALGVALVLLGNFGQAAAKLSSQADQERSLWQAQHQAQLLASQLKLAAAEKVCGAVQLHCA